MTEKITKFICWYFIISAIALTLNKAAKVQKRSINLNEKQNVDIYQPEYEHQIIAWPEENLTENINDNSDEFINQTPTALATLITTSSTQKPVKVIENFHNILPNETQEYKLSLDNGSLNYKRIDKKVTRNGLTDTIQEGYYSIPLTKTRRQGNNQGDQQQQQQQQYQILHYKADANGYNVYIVDKTSRHYPK